jgi:hypothetical protein
VTGDYTLLITDQYLTVAGDPIACWTNIDLTLRFNEPSSGMFVAPGFSWIREQIAPGRRVVVIRDQTVLVAGPIEKFQYERSDDGENAGVGVLTVNFADDLACVAGRLTYPDPTLAPSAQVTDNWTYTGSAELALRDLVDYNAGQNALAARRVPTLRLDNPAAGVGGSVTAKADRMEPLGDVMRRVAVAGGGLGFRARQIGTEIVFDVFQPLDKSAEVFFGFGAGNLKYISYEVNAPAATTAVVGGQGEGADRFLIERTAAGAEGAWGRYETLVNRPGNDPLADLQAAGDEELADKAETVRLPMSAADTPVQRFGIDYELGTKVSVETWPGSMISDIVTSVHIQVYPTAGEVVSPVIGSQAESTDPKWQQRLRAMDRRVSYLERNVVPASA